MTYLRRNNLFPPISRRFLLRVGVAIAALAVMLSGATGPGALAAEDRGDTRPVSGQQQNDRVPSALIELDGSDSYNPEGEDLHFAWRQLDGPRVKLSDPNAAKPYFRTSQPGYYVFELVVTANGMKSEPFVLDFEIEMMNMPPVAKAPFEVSGEVGKAIEIDGRDSFDPEGANLTYRWRPLTRGLDIPLSALNRPLLVFEPTLDGVFELELVVSDGETVSQPVITRLMIRPKPKPPVARAKINTLDIPTAPLPPQTMAPPAGSKPRAIIEAPAVVQAGASVLLDARGSRGSSGNRLEYLWKQKSGPFVTDFELVFDGAAQHFSPPRVGDYEFELTVVDGKLESDPIIHRVKAISETQPPVAVVDYPARAMPGALVKMDATQSYDIEGSKLDFRWRQTGGPAVRNYVIDETLGKRAPAFYPPVPGVYSFELIVDNGKLRSKPFEIHIEVGDARRPPNISIKGLEVTHTGERVSLGAVCDETAERDLTFVWKQVEGPAPALPETYGAHTEIVPPRSGRYVIDLSAMEKGRVVATARRTLEVFDPPGGASPAAFPDAVDAGLMPQPESGPPPEPLPEAHYAPPPVTESIPAMGAVTEPRTSPPAPALQPVRPAEQRGRASAQIHPSTRGGGIYDFDSQSHPLEPIAPIAP